MNFNIIKTGSAGNAVTIDDRVLVDCGVPYKTLGNAVRRISLVLLTHIHTDHFRAATLKRLAKERPMLRFGCCEWLVKPLLDAGVPAKRIDVYQPGMEYRYGNMTISPVLLKHNVPQCGYKVMTDNGKALYCTDTNSLDGVDAKDFDLYLLEANYTDEGIRERIREKEESGEYAYEYEVLENHLSKEKCDDFLACNAGAHSEFVYLHEHEERRGKCKEKSSNTSTTSPPMENESIGSPLNSTTISEDSATS